jgi:Nif-specific regulatory protein
MYCDKYKRNCYADSDLTFLVDISNTISHGTDLDRDLEVVMKKLCEFLGAKRGAITIIDQDNETIMINAAYGLTEEEKRRGVYKIGEGITGKVVETGHPVIIRDITTNDHFLNKTGVIIKAGEIVAFLCVPVIMKNEVRGTLSIHKIHTGNIDFNAEIKFLSIIGMLIGQNVSARSRQIEELNQLRAENRHLKNGTSNRPENIIGNTAIMRNLYDLIEKVAPKNTTGKRCRQGTDC